MKITCTGHSGFLIEFPGVNLIFDYYTDRENIVTPEVFRGKPTYVFVSHRHRDHYNKKIFNWSEWGDVTYILDSGCKIPPGIKENVRKIREGDEITVANGEITVKAYGSTDEGVSFLVKAPGGAGAAVTVFHAGDLNDWYWADESTPAELAADEENYLRVVRQLAGTGIDIAFIPEDPRLGLHAGRGIRFFREIAAPKRIIPMHFPGNEGVSTEMEGEAWSVVR